MSKFNVGDVVKLRTGEAHMVVTGVIIHSEGFATEYSLRYIQGKNTYVHGQGQIEMVKPLVKEVEVPIYCFGNNTDPYSLLSTHGEWATVQYGRNRPIVVRCGDLKVDQPYVIEVRFAGRHKHYYYLSDKDSVKVGDFLQCEKTGDVLKVLRVGVRHHKATYRLCATHLRRGATIE